MKHRIISIQSFHLAHDLFSFCFDTLEWHNFLKSHQSADHAGIEIAPLQGKYTQKENKSIMMNETKVDGNNLMYHT